VQHPMFVYKPFQARLFATGATLRIRIMSIGSIGARARGTSAMGRLRSICLHILKKQLISRSARQVIIGVKP